MPAKAVKVRPRVFDVGLPVEENNFAIDLFSNNFKDEVPILGESVENASVQAEVYDNVILKIPHSLYEEYTKVAASQDQTIEEVMQHRLDSCKAHNAIRGLWFSDSERTQLENLLQKRPLAAASQAITIITNLGNINIEDLKINLTPAQRKVLGLAMYGGRTPQKFFEDMIRRELRV